MSDQAYVKQKLAQPEALEGVSRLKSKANLGGYRPRTLQRVSLAKWEEDADLEQGDEHGAGESSVSISLLSVFQLALAQLSLMLSYFAAC